MSRWIGLANKGVGGCKCGHENVQVDGLGKVKCRISGNAEKMGSSE